MGCVLMESDRSTPLRIHGGAESKTEVEVVKGIGCQALSTYNYTCRSLGFI